MRSIASRAFTLREGSASHLNHPEADGQEEHDSQSPLLRPVKVMDHDYQRSIEGTPGEIPPFARPDCARQSQCPGNLCPRSGETCEIRMQHLLPLCRHRMCCALFGHSLLELEQPRERQRRAVAHFSANPTTAAIFQKFSEFG